uniref:Uncharacterized protein n=1 Tax=Cacopsylla melanoneura TaxID=428564 RepID=A0A8D8SXK1_9HEMI
MAPTTRIARNPTVSPTMSVADVSSSGSSSGSSGSRTPSLKLRKYVDPWDLENYAFLQRHSCDDATSAESSAILSLSTAGGLDSANSDFYYVPTKDGTEEPSVKKFQRSVSSSLEYRDRILVEPVDNSRDIYMCPEFRELDCRVLPPGPPHHRPHWRLESDLPPVPSPLYKSLARHRNPKSFARDLSSEDYYSSTTDVKSESSTLTYEDLIQMKQKNRFSFNTQGHLKLDYSHNWNKLGKYIANCG